MTCSQACAYLEAGEVRQGAFQPAEVQALLKPIKLPLPCRVAMAGRLLGVEDEEIGYLLNVPPDAVAGYIEQGMVIIRRQT